MKLLDLKAILETVGIPVYHYESLGEELPRIVYQEYAIRQEYASNGATEETTPIEINHFTDIEFDESLEELKRVLRVNKIPFTGEISFDPQTKVATTTLDISITEIIDD
jgi:hypothetical protein